MTLADAPQTVLPMLAATLLLLLLAELFKNVEPDWKSSFFQPALAGLAAGALIYGAHATLGFTAGAVVTGFAFTLAVAYLQRRGMHAEPIEGWMAGGVAGATAALIMVPLAERSPALAASSLLLSGATAGTIYAALYERLPRYTAPANLASWAASAGASLLPGMLAQTVPAVRLALIIAAALPAVIVAATFLNRRALVRELREEVALGLFPDEELGPATNPLLRWLKRGEDRALRRRFVSITNELATRKRRQRIARADLARLYQLDVLKLRRELQEVLRVQRAMSSDASSKARMQSDVS